MKKIFSSILILILLYITLFFDWKFSFGFKIFGIIPSFFVIFIAFVLIYADTKMAILVSVIGGLLIDFCLTKIIGITPIAAIITVALFSNFKEIISENGELIFIFTIFCMTIIFELVKVLLDMGMNSYRIQPEVLFNTLFIEAFVTTLIFSAIYPILKFIGEKIKPIYTKNNILTRYF